MSFVFSPTFVADTKIIFRYDFIAPLIKDTHRGKAPSSETPALTKSTNMGILVFGTTNQLSVRGY